jgi:hypothetical protein
MTQPELPPRLLPLQSGVEDLPDARIARLKPEGLTQLSDGFRESIFIQQRQRKIEMHHLKGSVPVQS